VRRHRYLSHFSHLSHPSPQATEQPVRRYPAQSVRICGEAAGLQFLIRLHSALALYLWKYGENILHHDLLIVSCHAPFFDLQ
jgi:hypothetical protein